MKILVISTSVYPIPLQGYGGTEQLAYILAKGYYDMGHQVSVVCPVGSVLPAGVEHIPCEIREDEGSYFHKYRDRLIDFDVIHDHSFCSWVYMASAGNDPSLPIVKTFHTDPSIWGSSPPVPHPCIVGISQSHARRLALHLGVATECVYNGIDMELYAPPAIEAKKRNGRLLFVGRYSPEKGPLEAMQMAKRLKMPLDCYGDTQIVSSNGYVDRCRNEADGILVRFYTGVSRKSVVDLYQSYRALLYLPNWDEPFGLVPVEAQACGLPVVTLKRGSLPEVVKDGVTGWVCNTSAEVEQVLKDGRYLQIKSEDCIQFAREFTIERMVQGYLSLFERVRQGFVW